MEMAKSKSRPLENASQIIERFGGIRPMAAKIDVPVTTVQGWKKRDVIPATRREQILNAAQDNNIDLADITAGGSLEKTSTDAKDVKPTITSKSTVSSKTDSKPKDKADKAATTFPADKAENKKPAAATIAGVGAGASAATSSAAESRENTVSAKTAASNTQKSPEEKLSESEHDRLMSEMHENSRKTMISSAWIAAGVVAAVLVIAFFFFWPGDEQSVVQTREIEQKIEQLESDVNDVNERTSFFGTVMPEDLQAKMDNLQNQAQSLQTKMSELSERASEISSEVMAEDAGPLSNRLAILEREVEALSGEGNFAALIERVRQLENSAGGQDMLEQSVQQLQEMIGGQESGQKVTQELAEAQSAQDGALGQTLQGVSMEDLQAAAMLLAFSKFRETLNREEPFEDDLVLLQNLAGDNAELLNALNRLAPEADDGVLTPAGLSNELKSLTGDIVFSSLKGEDVSLQEKAAARMNNVFQVEKDGVPVSGTQTQQTVARAQQSLDEGNIEQAIKELQSLEGEAAQTARPLIEEAEMTLLAERVQNMIGNNILSRLGGENPFSGMMNGQGISDAVKGLDAGAMKDALDQTMGGGEVIQDEESGLSILPKRQGFKGLSDR
jgi:hypothetical protein